jgi:hypothetical protein
MMTIDFWVELFLPFAGQSFVRKSECIANGGAKQAPDDATVFLTLANLS